MHFFFSTQVPFWTKFAANKTRLPVSPRYLKLLPEYYFNHIFRETAGLFKTWASSFLILEIGHFHSCTVNTDEGKDWLGRVESKRG